MKLKTIDLFAGIGGFTLGLEATGFFEPVTFVENHPKRQAVLRKWWPDVPCHADVRTFDGKRYKGSVDLVCGGPPCQPASRAGKRRGAQDDRWLWPETVRIVKEVEPRWIAFENPSGIFDVVEFSSVLASLEGFGFWNYEDENGRQIVPIVIPACAVGALHRRDRVWIIAWRGDVPDAFSDRWFKDGAWEPSASGEKTGDGWWQDVRHALRWTLQRVRALGEVGSAQAARESLEEKWQRLRRPVRRSGEDVPNTDSNGEQQSQGPKPKERRWVGDGSTAHVRYSAGARLPHWRREAVGGREAQPQPERSGGFSFGPSAPAYADLSGLVKQCGGESIRQKLAPFECRRWWGIEPGVGRVAHGVSGRVDRLEGLGNAVLPQVPFAFGLKIALLHYEFLTLKG